MMNILEKNVNNVERFYGFTAFHIGQSPKKRKELVVHVVLEHKFELRNHCKPYFL